MTDRPNFLFIITDQHRADYLGCAGHPVLKTPHIDGIAARGVRFDRFYVANPVCMPNRSTLMTGRMPSLHGVRHNGIPLSLRANTFVDLLRASGYHTALMGKSHLQNMTDRAAILQRAEPENGRALPPPEFAEATKPEPDVSAYGQEHPSKWRGGDFAELRLPFYGYEHVDLCTEHGDRVGGHYFHWLSQRHADANSLRGADNALPHDYVCPQAYRTAVPEELYPTTYIAEKTLEYLDGFAAGGADNPFFAMVSFPDPHHPFTPPGKYWGKYSPDDMALPPSFEPGTRPVPPHVAWAREQRDAGTAARGAQSAFAVTEREAREAMALTCDMIAMIDDAVGRILGRLGELGLADDTVVVFNADHGDFLADHQLLLKGPAYFQGLVRVPFLWADTPDRARPGATNALASTVDIASTILDRAGIEPYNGIQGDSLLDVVGGAGGGHDSIVIEDDQQRTYMGFEKPPRARTLITERWRLSVYQDLGWGELYDLSEDPHEMENLWDDPERADIRGELFETLARRQMELVDRSPLPTATA